MYLALAAHLEAAEHLLRIGARIPRRLVTMDNMQ